MYFGKVLNSFVKKLEKFLEILLKNFNPILEIKQLFVNFPEILDELREYFQKCWEIFGQIIRKYSRGKFGKNF